MALLRRLTLGALRSPPEYLREARLLRQLMPVSHFLGGQLRLLAFIVLVFYLLSLAASRSILLRVSGFRLPFPRLGLRLRLVLGMRPLGLPQEIQQGLRGRPRGFHVPAWETCPRRLPRRP